MLLNCGVGEDSWQSLGSKEIQPVHPEGNQSWIFIGRTDAEAETPILCPPDVKNWLIGKDPDARKDWRREVKGTTEDEMVGWHHWHDGRVWVGSGIGDEQGSLVCWSPWGHRESDTTEWLNWTEAHFWKHIVWMSLCMWTVISLEFLYSLYLFYKERPQKMPKNTSMKDPRLWLCLMLDVPVLFGGILHE